MIKLRPNLRAWFRAATEEEFSELEQCAAIRKTMTADERAEIGAPDVAESCLPASLYWTAVVLWQDRPAFVCAGIAAVLGVFGIKIYQIGKYLLT